MPPAIFSVLLMRHLGWCAIQCSALPETADRHRLIHHAAGLVQVPVPWHARPWECAAALCRGGGAVWPGWWSRLAAAAGLIVQVLKTCVKLATRDSGRGRASWQSRKMQEQCVQAGQTQELLQDVATLHRCLCGAKLGRFWGHIVVDAFFLQCHLHTVLSFYCMVLCACTLLNVHFARSVKGTILRVCLYVVLPAWQLPAWSPAVNVTCCAHALTQRCSSCVSRHILTHVGGK